jgi:hypothetical protein
VEYDVDIVREKANQAGDHFDIQVKPRGAGNNAACDPK